jgi:hypothetical protein
LSFSFPFVPFTLDRLSGIQPDAFASNHFASSETPLLQLTITHVPAQSTPSSSPSSSSGNNESKWWTVLTVGVNHGVADADALFKFMDCWSHYTKQGTTSNAVAWHTRVVRASDRLIWPREDEHKGVTWDQARRAGQVQGGLRGAPPANLAFRAPVYTKSQIEALKDHVRIKQPSLHVVSSNDVLVAHHWRMYAIMCTHIDPDTIMILYIVNNFKKRPWFTSLAPHLDADYVGPVLSHILVEATRKQLLEWDLGQVS